MGHWPSTEADSDSGIKGTATKGTEGAAVEIVLVFTLFVLLPLLAVRFGYDSREGLRSKEEELASCGLTWHDLAGR